jgi:hypothetical protein
VLRSLIWRDFANFVEANQGLTQKEMGSHSRCKSYKPLVKPLKKINFTRKKKTYSYEEQNEEERQQFIKMIKEEKNEDLVYVDQSGMDNRDIYEYGWGARRTKNIWSTTWQKEREE